MHYAWQKGKKKVFLNKVSKKELEMIIDDITYWTGSISMICSIQN